MADGGRKPFKNQNDEKYAMLKNGSASFWVAHSKSNLGYNPILSCELMNLIQNMMLDNQFSYKKIISHPWMLDEDATLEEAHFATNNS